MEFFTETMFTGMLEVPDYDAVDVISPFIGSIVDDCCGLFEIPKITKLCKLTWWTISTEGFQARDGWKASSVELNQESFKEFTYKIFSDHQALKNGMSWITFAIVFGRWAILLTYVQEFLRQPQTFWKGYSTSSKRARTVLEEVIKKESTRNAAYNSFKDGTEAPWNQNPSRVMAEKNNEAYFLKTGSVVILGAIENALQQAGCSTVLWRQWA